MRDLKAAKASAEQFEHMIHEQLRAYRACRTTDASPERLGSSTWLIRSSGSQRWSARSSFCSGTRPERSAILQVQEATASVSDHLPKRAVTSSLRARRPGPAPYAGHERRHPLTRPASNRYLWRQLRDMKGSADVECSAHRSRVLCPLVRMDTRSCPRCSGDQSRSPPPYESDAFASVTDFAERYADQNERDYEAFIRRSVRDDWIL
jgi:hypothetical protein